MENLKKLNFLLLAFVVVSAAFFSYSRIIKSKVGNSEIINSADAKIISNRSVLSDKPVDKLQVYYFHRTQRCSTCKSIGRFTGEVINQEFSKEAASGLIDFKEINVELSENRTLAKKFGATGPSLFINAIGEEKENIEQDINIWRLINNEAQFKEYLTGKINSLLVK